MAAKTPRKPKGETRAAVDGDAAPRLPHEHDESSDSGTSPPRQVLGPARRAGPAGRVDTTRGAEADAAYRRQKDGVPGRHNREP